MALAARHRCDGHPDRVAGRSVRCRVGRRSRRARAIVGPDAVPGQPPKREFLLSEKRPGDGEVQSRRIGALPIKLLLLLFLQNPGDEKLQGYSLLDEMRKKKLEQL